MIAKEKPQTPHAEKREQQACWEAGSHDFFPPVVVRHGAHLLEGSAEAVVIVCRRCGARAGAGWNA